MITPKFSAYNSDLPKFISYIAYYAFFAHRHSFVPLCCRTCQYCRTFLHRFLCCCGTILMTVLWVGCDVGLAGFKEVVEAVISMFLVISIVFYSDRGHCYELFKKNECTMKI